MAGARNDGIEEEPFEFEEEPFEIEGQGPAVEEIGEEDIVEEAAAEYEPERPAEGAPSLFEGISPSVLKWAAVGAVVVVFFGVVAALGHRKAQRGRAVATRERALRARGIELTTELVEMARQYFASGKKDIPPDFHTRFTQDDVKEEVVEAYIREAAPGGIIFKTVARAVGRQMGSAREAPVKDKRPLPNTDIYMTRGVVVIELIEYPVRVFRQTLYDQNGQKIGRVALMLLDRRRPR